MTTPPAPLAASPATASTFPRRNALTQRFTLGHPRTINVANDGSRVAFVRSSAGDDPVNALWVLDLDDDRTTGTERLICDPAPLLAAADAAEMTDAEKARRERAREAGGGIVTYHASPDLSVAVFALSGLLFRVDLTTGAAERVDAAANVFDPRLDPTGTRIAYVSGGELRVTGDEHGDRLVIGEDDPTITWGSAEFIAAEEMGRSRGFWWSGDGTRLLAARVDTSAVPVWHIAAPVEPWKEPRPNRYPAAGSTNATVDLAMLPVPQVSTKSRVDIEWRSDEFEYLASARWGRRSEPTVVAQTRDQRTVAVLAVDPETGATREVARDVDASWIELVPGSPAWSGDRLVTVADDNTARRLLVDGVAVTPDTLQVRSLVNLTADAAIVQATTDSTQLHVARVSLDGSGVAMLTSGPGIHRATVGGSTVVVSSSSMDHFGPITCVLDGPTLQSFAEEPDLSPAVTFLRSGTTEIATAVVLPRDFDPNDDTPLPVLLDPYGGPHALRVQRARNAFLTSQWFADHGFAVVVADGRGTPRNPTWERSVRGDLASGVLDDQVDALTHVANDYPLDLERVAIRGWSFGGYLAALAVLRRPDVFHAAVAGAPVTDWRLYDTHYTERYLGHPATEPENYERTDLCAEAAKLTRPLLLIHGLADDNVVAAHTLSLSRALLEAGRPHQVLPLSGVTHMTPQAEVAENLLRLQLAFIDDALGIDRPATDSSTT